MKRLSQTFYANKETKRFMIFFLNDDEDQSVSVEEVEEINFSEIIQHLNFGGSVFITHIKKPELNINPKKKSKPMRKSDFNLVFRHEEA